MLPVALIALGFPAACRRSTPDSTAGAGSARSPSSRSAAPAKVSANAGAAVGSPPKAPCRVSTGIGTLEAPDAVLGPRSELDGTRFVTLAAGQRLSLRHERTQRELTLLGPGRFLPCVDGGEQVLVVEGGVKSTAGVGAHAGGEVVLATPFGLLRYADAGVDVKVAPSRLSLEVQAGEATFDAPPNRGASEPKPKRLRGPKAVFEATKAADAETAVEHCRSARASSGALARPPRLAGSARAELGTWAVASFEARRRARLACSLARVVIASRPEAERKHLGDLLEGRESGSESAAPAPKTEKK